MLGRAVPSDSGTACVRCGFPITSQQHHFRTIATGDNVLATLNDTTTELRFVCREG